MAKQIALLVSALSLLTSVASAADYHPATGKGNAPSAARAKAAREQAPGGCVVKFKITADGAIHRLSRCEYSK